MNIKYLPQFYLDLIIRRVKLITFNLGSINELENLLKGKKIKLIIFDFDDTLAEFGALLDESTKSLLAALAAKYQIAVFSNCSKRRNKQLEAELSPLGVFNVNRSDKPNPEGFYEVMQQYSADKTTTMVVGDRLGTDIYGAYLAGINHRVLVAPYPKSSQSLIPWGIKLIRGFENFIYFKLLKNGK